MRRHAAASIDPNVSSTSLAKKSFASQQPRLFMDFIQTAFPTMYTYNQFRYGNGPDFPEYIGSQFGSHPFLDATICCLSAVYLGHLTKDPKLQVASQRMYSDALRKVYRALATDAAMSDAMLSTIMLLTVYEMYAQTTKDAWIYHARAARQLFLRRGVKAHLSGFGRSCYYSFRAFLIAHALAEGQPCFLDEDEWQDFALRVLEEDSQKPGEWSAFAPVEDVIFMELVKCPRYLSDARAITSTTPCDEVVSLIQRIRTTCFKLEQLSDQLRYSIAAHCQRKRGIITRPGSFIGPIPEAFPVTSPALLLRGATSAITTLKKLLQTITVEEAESPRVEEVASRTPSVTYSSSETVSSESSPQTVSSAESSTRTFSLPFRIVSEVSRGPPRTAGKDDPEAVTWLDRIASSMGMLGADIVYENEDSSPVVFEVE